MLFAVFELYEFSKLRFENVIIKVESTYIKRTFLFIFKNKYCCKSRKQKKKIFSVVKNEKNEVVNKYLFIFKIKI